MLLLFDPLIAFFSQCNNSFLVSITVQNKLLEYFFGRQGIVHLKQDHHLDNAMKISVLGCKV